MSSSIIRTERAHDERRVLAYHVTARLADDRAIARTPEALRLASVTIKQHGESRGLLSYRLADTHAHSLLACSRAEAGRFALFSEAGLHKRLRLPVSFEAARIRPVDTPRYLFSSLRYLFRQEAHHGTSFDLAHDGSSLPELLGMRAVEGGLLRRVRERLPRLTRAQLLEWLDAPGLDSCETDALLIVDAAAAAFLLPHLVGTGARQARARIAAVEVLGRLHPSADAGELLRIPDRSLRRYRSTPPLVADCRAVEHQLRLRSLLQRSVVAEVA